MRMIWFLVGTLTASTPAFAGASFRTFDYGADDGFSYVAAVSADGSVVAGTRGLSLDTYEAFRWTAATGVVGLGVLTAESYSTTGDDISADGSVIAGTDFASSGQAVRWTAGGAWAGLGDLPGGGFESFGYGISGDGLVVVGSGFMEYSLGGYRSFRWSAATGMVGLGDIPAEYESDYATCASADGSVIAGAMYNYFGSALLDEAYRWTEATGIVGLGDLPGGEQRSFATAMSINGSVIVGAGTTAAGTEAFLWTQANGMVGLGAGSFASGVSGDGRIVVGMVNSEAVIWTALTDMRSLKELATEFGLDLTGWQLVSADDISQDGSTIVGSAVNPVGKTVAYVLRLTDFDHDGYRTPQDCDDLSAAIHPRAPEVKGDGVDQDCNGYDLTIQVKRAIYLATPRRLLVDATSALGASANLSVTGYGAMTWDATRQMWSLRLSDVATVPGRITVTGVEGQAVAPVSVR